MSMCPLHKKLDQSHTELTEEGSEFNLIDDDGSMMEDEYDDDDQGRHPSSPHQILEYFRCDFAPLGSLVSQFFLSSFFCGKDDLLESVRSTATVEEEDAVNKPTSSLILRSFTDETRDDEDTDSSNETTSPTKQEEEEREQEVPSYQLDDFERHKILGEGQFGQVWLVSEKKKQQPFALKVLSKYDLIAADEVQQIVTETNLLARVVHPFIVRLEAMFQDEHLIYLLQEFCQGGELFSCLYNHPSGLPESQAAFYTACIADALAYLHGQKILYRDLKPENVMVDASGYPKLIDLGFAKVLQDGEEKTFTFCGTPRYLAPECIERKGHSYGADHWGLGVLVYEMLTGENPFYWEGLDDATLFVNITECHYDALPETISKKAADLVARLLVLDPTRKTRLQQPKRDYGARVA